ncbi:hypothetical protein SCNU_18973 [Gordonia neofelifaecis NRRL B-59395]|uniref:Uncharacterized protein n=2 Tax=Gordonia TaxID=2053 RepID=F1YPE0_9ACTN|nr:hypothetical protein SCNU_18973 [Gordonia neofelifaecis NRRL B-59395]
MRGYDRDQVTDHLRRLDAELRMMAADRDAAHANSDELQGHLDEARHRIRDLQDEVNTLSVPPTTVAGMTDRVSRMLQLATDEASEVRANARDEADETVSVARQEADDIRASAAAAATRTKELAQEHADSIITDAEKRAAEIDEAAQKRAEESKKEQEDARKRAQEIIAAAEADAARLRGAAHNISMTRLARSRDLAESAHDAHRQILDHLDALREHITNLPDALALSEEERDLVSLTETDDLELLNRTLLGRDKFSASDAATPAEKTDVLGAVDDEYDEEFENDRYGHGPRDEAKKGDQVTA